MPVRTYFLIALSVTGNEIYVGAIDLGNGAGLLQINCCASLTRS